MRRPLFSALLAIQIAVISLSAGAASARPVVFHVSDPVRPDETALLFGDGIGRAVQAEGWRVPDTAVTAPPDSAPGTPSHGQTLDVLQRALRRIHDMGRTGNAV